MRKIFNIWSFHIFLARKSKKIATFTFPLNTLNNIYIYGLNCKYSPRKISKNIAYKHTRWIPRWTCILVNKGRIYDSAFIWEYAGQRKPVIQNLSLQDALLWKLFTVIWWKNFQTCLSNCKSDRSSCFYKTPPKRLLLIWAITINFISSWLHF